MRRWEINGKVGSGKLKERERGRRSEKETFFFFFSSPAPRSLFCVLRQLRARIIKALRDVRRARRL